MRPVFFLFLVLALLIISCKKSSLNTNIPIGTYKGTFQRSIMNKVSNVTLQFSSNSYKGQSDSIHYPDICKGSFSISKDTVSLRIPVFTQQTLTGHIFLTESIKFQFLETLLL